MGSNVMPSYGFVGNLQAHRYRIMIDYLSTHDCKNILEIGTHKGHTASELIRSSKNKNISYYGVDVFLEGWSKKVELEEQSIKPDSKEFVENFLKQYSQNIFLFQGTSKERHADIEKLGIKFDLIWIDGGHSYSTLRDDFFMYKSLLTEDGVIFIDDYTTEFSYPPGNNIPLGIKPFVDDLIKFDQFDVRVHNEYVDEYRGHHYKIASVRKKPSLEVITLVTPNNRKLLNDFFLPTLPKDITDSNIYLVNGLDLEKNNWSMDVGQINESNKDILSRFNILMNKKTEFQRNYVANNMGKKIMFIDTDVVFFRPFKDEVLYYLETHDMVMQDNNDDLNGGVWAMNCNEKVLKLFNELYSEIFMNFKSWGLDRTFLDECGEQAIINSIIRKHIRENGLVVGKLPVTFYANHINSNRFPNNPPSECILFHATNTANLEEKYNILTSAMQILK
jgi:predicted O-methyltransferase YrrM